PPQYPFSCQAKQGRCPRFRQRRCLLKDCERWFRPSHPQGRYCSSACQQSARRWRRRHASQRYRAGTQGKERRREQSRRYRQRRLQPMCTLADDAAATAPAASAAACRRRILPRLGGAGRSGRVWLRPAPRFLSQRARIGETSVMSDWDASEVRPLAVEVLGERYRRYRLSDPAAEEAMARSLRRYGQIAPVVVCVHDGTAEVVDGFKRLAAARLLLPRLATLSVRSLAV